LATVPFLLLNNHLKSKFVQNGQSRFDAGGEQRQAFFAEALEARRRISGEAIGNKRSLI